MVGKVIESIIKEELTDFLETNKLLADSQHGFRRDRSTTTNLLDFCDHLTKELDCGNNVGVAFLDFQKAFDEVSHSKLITKL